MSITHEQAQKLTQLKLDQTLSTEESAKLSAHLQGCSECTVYAKEMEEIAHMLPPLMKRQWKAHLVPLSIPALVRKNEKSQLNTFLTMRKTAVSLVVMALFFSAWQFVFSNPHSQEQSSKIPPVPTPSSPTLSSIGTGSALKGCTIVLYTVQDNDTLSSIAEEFSIPEHSIVEFNQLESEAVHEAMELMLPVCPFTPTGTFHAATFTTTLTPVQNFRTSTPGG